MPYMKVKMKCKKSSGKSGTHAVYKKKPGGKRGKRVGCTSEPKQYMRALGIHAEEKENNTMESVFENWKRFLNEFKKTPESSTISYDSSARGFVVSKKQLESLNSVIAKIYKEAARTFGTTVETIPSLKPSDLLSSFYFQTLNESIESDKKWKELEKEFTPEEKEKMFSRFGVKSWEELDDKNKDLIIRRLEYWDPSSALKQKIGTVKDLKKGLGEMSPEEFEKEGYVIPVPFEVLEDFRFMVNELKEDGGIADLYEGARDWYHKIRELLDQETDSDQDATLLGLLIATYSPRAKFALNLTEAAFMFKAVEMDKKQAPDLLKKYLQTFPGAEKRSAGEYRGFTKAHKVPNFTLNLIAPELSGKRTSASDLEYNEMYMWNSTIDTWMIDAFYPGLKSVSTTKEWETIKGKMMSNVVNYRYMAGLVAQEAKKLALLPHELQAIVWVASQIRQTGEKGLGVTTEFATDQIKQSILNIDKIKQSFKDELENQKEIVQYLEGSNIAKEFKEEFGNKSWLKVILDKIKAEGFEEAASYTLGIKDEKGKIIAPGVRSITSRGKKGKEPERFPAEPAIKTKKDKDKAKKAKKKKVTDYKNEEVYGKLNVFHVMNKIIQMPTGKFNNLHDSIVLYMDKDFSKEKAVEYILGRFDPKAKASKDYFTENKRRIKIRILKS